MARDTATQEQILQAIVDRLIEKIDVAHAENCFFSDEPYPMEIPPGDVFFSVSPGDGVFPEEFFASGGEFQVTEFTDVRISTFVALNEVVTEIKQSLLSPQRGLISVYKREILSSLLKDSWEPAYGGNQLLRNMIRPVRASKPERFNYGEGPGHLGASLHFATDFDWTL